MKTHIHKTGKEEEQSKCEREREQSICLNSRLSDKGSKK